MTDTANRWKLGLFVIAAGAVLIAGMVWIGYARLQKVSHEFHAFFDEAVTGLQDGAVVRFRGVEIGNVTRIAVAPDKKHIQVTAALYDERLEDLGLDPMRIERGDLPPGLRAQIVGSLFTGLAFVQVDYFPGDAEGLPPYPFQVPRNTIKTVSSTFKSFEEGARDVVRLLPALLEETRTLLASVQRDLTEAELPALVQTVRATFGELQRTLERAESAGLLVETSDAMREVRQLAADLRSDDGRLQSLLRAMDRLAADASSTLKDTGGKVRDASADLSVLARDLRSELQTVRRALVAVERLADSLEHDPGALLRGRAAASSPLESGK